MGRNARPGTLAGLAAVALVLALPASVSAHKGSPNYRSTVRAVDPPVAGVDVQVLNYDDRLLLVNKTGREVEVRGYDGEPYFRILADGTVQVNKRSPSYYLNLDRFGNVKVPSDARSGAMHGSSCAVSSARNACSSRIAASLRRSGR